MPSLAARLSETSTEFLCLSQLSEFPVFLLLSKDDCAQVMTGFHVSPTTPSPLTSICPVIQKRRSRHPHPEARQSGIREAAIAALAIFPTTPDLRAQKLSTDRDSGGKRKSSPASQSIRFVIAECSPQHLDGSRTTHRGCREKGEWMPATAEGANLYFLHTRAR